MTQCRKIVELMQRPWINMSFGQTHGRKNGWRDATHPLGLLCAPSNFDRETEQIIIINELSAMECCISWLLPDTPTVPSEVLVIASLHLKSTCYFECERPFAFASTLQRRERTTTERQMLSISTPDCSILFLFTAESFGNQDAEVLRCVRNGVLS